MKTNEKNQKNIFHICTTGVLAALIALLTAFIKLPTINGYVHFGDSLIYFACIMLPFPFGIAAAGIGGGLADLIAGYQIYIIPTIVIKSINALILYLAIGKKPLKQLICTRTIIGIILSGAFTVAGYFVAEEFILKNGGFASIYTNTIQAIASGVIFLLLCRLLNNRLIKKQNLD